MKTSLHQGTYKALNVYFLSGLKKSSGKENTVGTCTMPVDDVIVFPGSETVWKDGCMVDIAVMPRGMHKNLNHGITAVHEIGHWMGWFHIFDGETCDRNGDKVDDTPIGKKEIFGCPEEKHINSCPDSPGFDSMRSFSMCFSIPKPER